MNDPTATYQAESKPFQLLRASRIGLKTPRTRVTNCGLLAAEGVTSRTVAIKGVDTVLFQEGEFERFGYTQELPAADLSKADLSDVPTTVQKWLPEKIDWRVTVVGARAFPVVVLDKDTGGIQTDWRTTPKDRLTYVPKALPGHVERACVDLISRLGLIFGAVDLVESKGEYYFLEVNPTGEWSWLVRQASLPIDEALVDELCRGA